MPIRRNVTESIVSKNLMTGQTSVGISTQPGSRVTKPFGDKPLLAQANGTPSKPLASQHQPHSTTTTCHSSGDEARRSGGVPLAVQAQARGYHRQHHDTDIIGTAVAEPRVGLSDEREASVVGGGGSTTLGAATRVDHDTKKRENLVKQSLREDVAPLAGAHHGDVDICDVKPASIRGKSSSRTYVEMATQENINKTHANEDRSLKGACGPVNVFGVMDGHDGVYAAKLVQDQFLKLFESELRGVNKNVTGAVTETITRIENMLAKKQSSSGACCLICVHLNRYVWCANLGDCRACFIPLAAKCQVTGMGNGFQINASERNGVPHKNTCIGRNTTSLVWLSRDMKSCQSYERERIERAGGRVVDGRVEGLEPSRTVGDFDVKMRCPPSVISTEPEFRLLDLHDYGPGIILCCTDGIWDVLSGLDIDRIVKSKLHMLEADLCNPNEGLLAIAKEVVALAVASSSVDDCTAVCALVDG